MRKFLAIFLSITFLLSTNAEAAHRKSKLWGRAKPPYGAVVDWGDPISDRLAAYWLLNEGGGLKAFDISGRNNTGTLTNGPVWKPGKFGTALSFDGSDDNVLSANNIGLSGNLNATISAWVYVVGTKSLQSIVAFGGSNSNSVLSLFLNINGTDTGILSSEFNGGISVRTVAGTISKNQWYHVVVTKTPGGSDTTAKIYVNGTQQAVTGGSSTAPDITNSQVYIGKYTDSEHRFDGRIDGVRIYNRALTASEVRQLYEEPFAGLVSPKMFFVQPAAATPTNTSNFFLMWGDS